MYTLDKYLPEHEAAAERVYIQAYYEAYTRVYEPGHSDDRERLIYWSELANWAGSRARERALAQTQPSPVQPAAT